MDAGLALRLDSRSPLYESALFNKLARTAKNYTQAGISVLEYYIPDLDISQDMVNCYGPTRKHEFEKLNRGAPENFIHPMTATEVWTLATFVSQILFGGETTRRVEPRNPEDESKADIINELLRWNDNQQPTYNQGFHWCLDSISTNRGVMYDHWQTMMQVHLEPVEYEMPWVPPEVDAKGKPAIDPETGRRYKKPKDHKGEVVTRFRKVRKPVGGFTKIDLVSPYDFICDPGFPLLRFQEGRFAGHRVVLPWTELKRRSELPVDDYQYVLPAVVEKLKNSKNKKITSVSTGATTSTSRSFFERQRRNQPVTTVTGSDKIDKEDGGVVECFCVQVRIRPSVYEIFPEDTEEEHVELLISGDTDLLSVNVMTNKHDQFPYAVGEARPNAHMQFSPSWALIIKGPQDGIDYLARRRRESLARTSGNIFIGNPAWVDFEAFVDPDKDGLFIPITPEGAGKPLDQIVKQVPVQDTTANFYQEMDYWQRCSEQTTGAHANVQGAQEEGEQTATEYAGTAQMAQGRISTVARLLSAIALCPQTDRIVSNAQQFMPDEMTIRIVGQQDQFDPDKPQEKFMTVRRDASVWQDDDGNPMPQLDDQGQPKIGPDGQPLIDDRASLPDIQGEFDVVPHDGSLPGADAKKVAALSRAVEAYSTNPALAIVFDITQPGSIDPKKLFQKLMKASGLPTQGLIVTTEEAAKNAQKQMMAQGGGLGMPPAAPPVGQPGSMPQAPVIVAPPAAPVPPGPAGLPSAGVLPPTPSAAPPLPSPQTV